MTPEAKVKASVVKLLKKYAVYHFFPATHGFGRSGVPDIICCFDGEFLALEIKAGNNKPTALQEREMNRIFDAGGSAYVINEDEVAKLDEWITLCRANKEATKKTLSNLRNLSKKMEAFRAWREAEDDDRC
jgi:Holliday junction resolvase